MKYYNNRIEVMWNVFVPSCILNRKSGKLYGRVIGEERLVLIDEDSVHATHGDKSIDYWMSPR